MCFQHAIVAQILYNKWFHDITVNKHSEVMAEKTERCLLLVFISAMYIMSLVILFLISYFRFIRTENNQPKSPTRKKKKTSLMIRNQESSTFIINFTLISCLQRFWICTVNTLYVSPLPLMPDFFVITYIALHFNFTSN